MGVYAGPEVKENGLVLALDASNNKSYSRNRFLCPGTIGEGASADNNVSFSLNGTGTFVRMGYNQTIGNYTIKPTDVVYKYVMGETGCFYHGNKITVPQGSYLNFSFDYLVTGATTYPITNYLANIEDYSSGGLGNNAIAPNSTQGIWQRRVMQSGPAATTVADCNVLLYPGACSSSRLADSGTIYYRNPRAEIINYDPDPNSIGSDSGFSYSNNINLVTDISGNNNNGTFTGTGYAPLYSSGNGGSWIFDGTNDYITSSFATISGQAVTYAGWLYSTETTATYRNFVDGNVTTRPMIWWNTSGQIEFDAAFYTTTAVYRNQWVHVALSKPSGSSSASYYVNGVLVGTGSAYTISALTPSWFNRSGAQTWKGNCSVIQAYNRALTASEISQNFNANRGRFGI